MNDDNSMALAYKADAEIAQAEAKKLRAALDGLMPWIERQCDIFCVDPKKYREYRAAKEAMDGVLEKVAS